MKGILILLLLSAAFYPLTSQEQDSLFQSAQGLYRSDQNEAAVGAFKVFLKAFPDDLKSDDAHWYLGRLYVRLGDEAQGEFHFKYVLSQEDSNRRTEAFYDLTKLLDKQDREEEILDLVPLVIPGDPSDKYSIRSLPVVFKSYYLVGLRFRSAKLGHQTMSIWNGALDLIDKYDSEEVDEETRELLDEQETRFLIRMATLAPNGPDYDEYLHRAGEALDFFRTSHDQSTETTMSLESDYQELVGITNEFDYKVDVAGVYDTLAKSAGFRADTMVSGGRDLRRDVFFGWKLGYNYDSLSFKTFNFNSAKTGNDRYYQWSHGIDGNLSLELGSKYFFLQTVDTGAGITIGEDPGSLNYRFDLSWDFMKSIGTSGVASLDNKFSSIFYPDYNNAGRELNSLLIAVSPGYTFVFAPKHELGLSYDFDYKYYLNAHFDTSGGGTDPDTRQYLIQRINVDYTLEILDPLTLDIAYDLEYLESQNYDVLISGNPANRFVTDLFDYILNAAEISANVKTGIYSGSVSAGYEIRNFLNYPARNVSQDFINELRMDQELNLSWENRFRVMKTDTNGQLDIYANAQYTSRTSNHSYEVSYLTNYDSFEVSVGLIYRD